MAYKFNPFTGNFDLDTSNPGDITSVVAGTGLTGGGTSGAVTLSLDTTYGGGYIVKTPTDSTTNVIQASPTTATGLTIKAANASGKNLILQSTDNNTTNAVFQVMDSTGSTPYFGINANGNTAIGYSAFPSATYQLEVNPQYTNPAGAARAFSSTMTVTHGSTYAAIQAGVVMIANASGTGALTATIGLRGGWFIAQRLGSNAITGMSAGVFKFSDLGSGTITAGYGLYVDAPTFTGTTSNYYSLYLGLLPNATTRHAILVESGDVIFNNAQLALSDFTIMGDTDASLFFLDASGDNITIGSTTEIGKFGIDGNADEKQFVVQSHSSQTANLTEWQDSVGTIGSYIAGDSINFSFGLSSKGRIYSGLDTIGTTDLTFKRHLNSYQNIIHFLTGADEYAQMGYQAASNNFSWLSARNDTALLFSVASVQVLGLYPSGLASYSVLITPQSSTQIGQVIKAVSSQTANLTEWQNSSGTKMTWIQEDGQLVYSNIGVSLVDGYAGIEVTKYHTSTDLGTDWYGIYDLLYTGVAQTGTVYGFKALASVGKSTAGSSPGVTGLNFQASVQHTAGSFDYAQGVVAAVTSGANGGSVSNAYGNYALVQVTHTQTWSNVMSYIAVLSQSAGTISNFYGFYLSTANRSAGTMTNEYGLYLEDVNDGGTLNFAIYTNDGLTSFGDHVKIRTDNDKLYFGTGDDATITYDGTDLVINPKAVGSGVVNITGGLQCDSITNDTGLAAGVYTPTLTNVTNISASTAYECQYMRVGNTVTVSGKVDMDITATGAFELGISLPIASNFGATEDCAGVGTGTTSTPSASDVVYIKADTTNDRASMNGDDNDTSNHTHYFTFTYQVI